MAVRHAITAFFARGPVIRRVGRMALLALLVFLMVVGWSVGGALTAPGTDGTAARLAEWGRDHGLGGVITWLERQQYEHNPPKIGGSPSGGIPVAGGATTGSPTPTGGPTTTIPAETRTTLPAPAAIPVLAGGPPLPGEGQWQTVVTVDGAPAVRVAELRPDSLHTSFVAGVMWIDPNLVRGQLQPGYRDPGGSWQAADSITPALQASVVAAFNAGFRLNASHGGYYSEGRTVVPLQDNAASLVLTTNGTAMVGSWNREVAMAPNVASVRQNLVMLVDNGQVNPTCSSGNAAWGATIGNEPTGPSVLERSDFRPVAARHADHRRRGFRATELTHRPSGRSAVTLCPTGRPGRRATVAASSVWFRHLTRRGTRPGDNTRTTRSALSWTMPYSTNRSTMVLVLRLRPRSRPACRSLSSVDSTKATAGAW
jgi:hypothetical protein